MRIAIIEDEIAIAEAVQTYLEMNNFVVDIFTDGAEGEQGLEINEYDCLVLDLNLPGKDGLSIAQDLREQGSKLPIIMLTAKTRHEDKITGFSNGTDDYLTKPFQMEELLWRIKALIKRASKENNAEIVLGDLVLNSDSQSVTQRQQNSKEEQISLNRKEFGILEYLARNRGRIISQEELIEHVWGDTIDMFTQTVKTNVKTLRQKIDPDKKLIQTVRGAGYVIY